MFDLAILILVIVFAKMYYKREKRKREEYQDYLESRFDPRD